MANFCKNYMQLGVNLMRHSKGSSKKLLDSKFLNSTNVNQARTYLLLHEYVSLGILQQYGIRVPKFKVASTPLEVREATSSGGFSIY